MKSKTFNPLLQAAYLEVVENQLRDNSPPETSLTLERLLKEGIKLKNAKLLIASVIAAETYMVTKSQTNFDQERFVRNLNRLPDRSFDNE